MLNYIGKVATNLNYYYVPDNIQKNKQYKEFMEKYQLYISSFNGKE
jgi:hypothetical protein